MPSKKGSSQPRSSDGLMSSDVHKSSLKGLELEAQVKWKVNGPNILQLWGVYSIKSKRNVIFMIQKWQLPLFCITNVDINKFFVLMSECG